MDTSTENIQLVEKNITIRFNPFIYAFSTNTIPNYLKVGDTFRGVDTRISEWQKNLAKKLSPQKVSLTEEYRHKALLSDEIYFRDYSVHEYLESLGKHRIEDEQIRKLYSQEFFEDTSAKDIEEAINAITDDYTGKSLNKKYTYYKVCDNKSATIHGDNSAEWKLRPNQEAVVNNFLNKSGQKELLMYAVMRFGKSFTAMYCAKESNARRILVVSAKADVAGEWQKTVETPKCFKHFRFVCDDDFKKGFNIENHLSASDENRVVVFLTLQNLTGKDKDDKNIKKKLQQIFDTVFDLIIVDETHYGAWANSYGAPLKDADEDIIKRERKDYEYFSENVAKLQYKQKLHLSGTPYNLLYDNKFDEDNIIATCQFKDILHDKIEWDNAHFEDIENGTINPDTGKPYQEYDNPYFGFPNMLRFAFNLPQETRQLLTKSKTAWTLNDLFETTIDNNVAKFSHEQEVLMLLKAIDGSEQVDGILGFLNIPKIKDNDVCKHMVFVLPRKYACDAMADLLNSHRNEFANLSNYTVLNITGHSMPAELDSVDKVKAKISELEKCGRKTITLTVYKMLTGVTVKEWDTMVMLKNTSSAQEYDQSIFRIQNQYVEEYTSPNGDIIKIDKKPQTILVDFDPVRLLTLQGMSAKIVDSVSHSADSLDDAITEELNFFPIIAYNSDKLVKVEPTDLIKLITEYSNDRSIVDSVQSVELDKKILNDADIKAYISNQSATSAKNTLDVPAHTGDDLSDVDVPLENEESTVATTTKTSVSTDDKNMDKELTKKFRMCIARLSFYAFLSESKIENLQSICDSLKETCAHYKENTRIFKHLQLNLDFVEKLNASMSRYYAGLVNDALKRADMLSHDESLGPQAQALNAIRNFNRFSDSEIVTPQKLCVDMVNCIGKDNLSTIVDSNGKILDIASKTGEFALAIVDLLKENVDFGKLKNSIYSIPTSGTAYEFTRHIYEVLKLNIDNIADPQNLTAYDLLKITKTVKGKETVDYDKIKSVLTQNKTFSQIKWNDIPSKGATDMINFEAVVGNPPYQEITGSTTAQATPIYNKFISIAKFLQPNYISIICPSRWFAGGMGLDAFRDEMLNDCHIFKLVDFLNAKDCFPSASIGGGVSYFLWDRNYNGECHYSCNHHGKTTESIRKLNEYDVFIRFNEAVEVIKKVNYSLPLSSIVSALNPFGISSSTRGTSKQETGSIKLIASDGASYITPDIVVTGLDLLKNYNIYISKTTSEHANEPDKKGQFKVISRVGILLPNEACTFSYFTIGSFNNVLEANNLLKYISTKLTRFLILQSISSINISKDKFRFVPMQDFTDASDIDWSKSIAEIDKQLYAKYNLTDDEIAFIESTIKPMV